MVTAVSLFSGCGGSDTGVHQLGINILMANDIIPYARDVYLANLPATDYLLQDIRTIESFPAADLLLGCYPCQGFSQGGLRQADNKLNFLYKEFARALNQIKPKAFIVENVSGMLRSNYEHLLKDQIDTFTRIGYRVKTQILNAADYGVPQLRHRIFIVGIPSALSFGVLAEWKLFGKTLFELWDYMITALIMPISSLLVAVFVGWIRQKSDVLAHMREGSSVPQALIVLWLNALRFLAPVAILLVFANTLGWI